ncbi:MAG: metallophosphoesterase [Myxococcales bacterium]|nr:metallophosphoesterase [Myxococcales bacterium]
MSSPPAPGKTVVIGDVHGCALELEELLRACAVGARDRVVLVGDLLSKGPDAVSVMKLIAEHRMEAVRGNHDAHLLGFWRARQAGQAPPRRLDPETLAQALLLTEDDWRWLDALPLWLRLPEHQALVVHAGLVPGVALEAQQPRDLLSLRTIDAEGRGSSRPDAGRPWGELWKGPELVLFGHHASRGLQRHAHAIGLDSGCVYGGALSAFILPDRRLVSVPARRVYRAIDPDDPSYAAGSVALETGEVRVVSLPPGAGGIPREALVLRDEEGFPQAYLNRCRHLAIPLDGGSRDFLTRDGQHLICRTHGAEYRRQDGLCVRGPCRGKSLTRLHLMQRGEQFYIEALDSA